MSRSVPLVGIVMVVYVGFALLGPTFGAADFDMVAFLTREIWKTVLPSGEAWLLDVGETFVLAGLVALIFAGIKAAGKSRISMGNHILSILSFIGGWRTFMMVKGFEPSPCFRVVVMVGVEAMAGMLVPILTARQGHGSENSDE